MCGPQVACVTGATFAGELGVASQMLSVGEINLTGARQFRRIDPEERHAYGMRPTEFISRDRAPAVVTPQTRCPFKTATLQFRHR